MRETRLFIEGRRETTEEDELCVEADDDGEWAEMDGGDRGWSSEGG